MTLIPGTRLGPYEIVAPLGSGGMGEVYRAKDTRLGRDVAIKALPRSFVSDPERLARIEREAKLLAALNHPNIAAIYGLEEAGGSPHLVLELVEGPTLGERIARGALPIEEALAIARQLAEALEYAHEHGVIHRDLKPDNVKLRPDGTVKVLDFGLARALESGASGASGDLSQSPTITQGMTSAGVLLGTAAYMSPEQARGRPADRRSDVWAFGAVLYEMLSGRRAFSGETISDTLAAIMRDDPDPAALPSGLSSRWRRLIARCLTKDPKQRLQAIGEARIALEDLAANPADEALAGGEASVARGRSKLESLVPWVSAALALLALVAVVLWRRPSPPSAATELSVVPIRGERIGADIAYQPIAISPDARIVAYTVRVGGELRLRLRRLDTREDTEVVGAENARNLFFSPDGQWVGFFDSRKMCKVSVRGGTPVPLADAGQDRLGTWLEDRTIVYAREVTEPLYRIPESGGEPIAVTRLDSTKHERTHRFPCALAGGPWVVFTAQTIGKPGGYDDATIEAVSVRTGERRLLLRGARRAVWAPPGHLVFARGNDLYAVPINPRDPRVTQEPVPVMAGVAGETSSGASHFSIADDGTLAWLPGGENDQTREIGWFDRSGRWTKSPVPAGEYRRVIPSRDGTRALVMAGPGGGTADLWLADLRTGAMNRITYAGRGGSAVWLPDGLRIVHSRSDSNGVEAVVLRRLDGAGGERELFRGRIPAQVSDVTRDGQWVLFADYGSVGGRIRLVSPSGPPAVRQLPGEGGSELAGVLSPDGRWLAYVSNKTRREEVCVRRFGDAAGSWQVSTNGGGGVRWGRDGRELFFVAGERLMRASVTADGENLSIGQPEALFDVPPSPTEPTFRDYAYDPVSDRFLFTRPPAGVDGNREIALSLGWARRLPERMRAKAARAR